MWLANQTLKNKAITFSFLERTLPLCEYKEIFDVNDPTLVAPDNMEEAIKNLLNHNPPKTDIELFASIYRSLAFCYKNSIEEFKKEFFSGKVEKTTGYISQAAGIELGKELY